MKTFEEGEWLARHGEMWMVKEIQSGHRPGESVTYNISNGYVETWASPERGGLYKLTLPVKNAVDSFVIARKKMHDITPPGFNWPDMSRVYENLFERICDLLEEHEGNYQDNDEFEKANRELWDEFKKLEEEIIDAVDASKGIKVGGVSMFRR